MTVGFAFDGPERAPVDAATVVIVREGGDHGIELFFVRRGSHLRFMGGAYVFPGGKLDPEDASPAVPGDLEESACRARLGESDVRSARALFVAAARECLEESGVLFADRPVDQPVIEAMRRALDIDHQPLHEVLAREGVSLRLSSLAPLARWITPRQEVRRFDARVFLAAAPRAAQASHDTRETVGSMWLSPRAALERADRGEIVLVAPTYRTVELLSLARTVDEALALAPSTPPRLEPHVRARGESIEILLPDDPEHPSPISPQPARGDGARWVTRFAYTEGRWTAIRP